MLNSCQALVIASFWEGFGLPALEAMACNTPVIASIAGALPEVVGDAGLLINPNDARSISDAMCQVIKDSNLRKSMILNGQNRLKFYSWEAAARQIELVLNDLKF